MALVTTHAAAKEKVRKTTLKTNYNVHLFLTLYFQHIVLCEARLRSS